jgi:TolA-binding protein
MRKSGTLGTLAILVTVGTLAAAAWGQTVGERLAAAEGLFQAGKYPEALAGYAALVRDHPRTDQAPAALVRWGECQEQLGRPAEALGTYERLRREYPRSPYEPRALLRLGVLYAGLSPTPPLEKGGPGGVERRLKEAQERLETLVRDWDWSVQAPEGWLRLGDVFLEQGQWAKAQEAYDTLKAKYPRSEWALAADFQKGYLPFRQKNYAAARKEWEALRQRRGLTHPQTPEITFAVGRCWEEEGQPRRAIHEYRSLVTLAPQHRLAPFAQARIGHCYYALGFQESAAEAFRQVLKRVAPDTPLAASAQAWIRAMTKR